MNNYDVIVIGAGHAGCEAAHILAKLKLKTLLLTLAKENIAKMPCNPSVGGPAKGIVVKEIDALGGIMPKIADLSALQFKILNSAKGPAVRALRVQSDKLLYSKLMRAELEKLPHLEIKEARVDKLYIKDNTACGVYLNDEIIHAKAIILTTGTYLDAKVMRGADISSSGPDNEDTSTYLSRQLEDLGFKLQRLKTGTPPRIHKDSVNYQLVNKELGTKEFNSFNLLTDESMIMDFEKQFPCYLTYTTKETQSIIENNLTKSTMYSGKVNSVGPRYCPSIEDKIVRFSDKERHQIFLEPESRELDTIYIQGFSSSMPIAVQDKMIKSIIGLENAKVIKYAYAIEYDAFDPLDIKKNLETKLIDNLFIAGQILGTSGYEEAAGLGIMAGINCYLKINNKDPFILGRDEAYIGVMIDDLCTKGTNEPYRLLTSRAEYRLLLRHDNAYDRLSEKAYKLGLLDEIFYDRIKEINNQVEELANELSKIKIKGNLPIVKELKDLAIISENISISALDLLKRPKVDLKLISKYYDLNYDHLVGEKLSINLKYDGYIKKCKREALKLAKMDNISLARINDYNQIDNLALEARAKLNKIKPLTLGQAARISGINPSDLQVIMIYLRMKDYEI